MDGRERGAQALKQLDWVINGNKKAKPWRDGVDLLMLLCKNKFTAQGGILGVGGQVVKSHTTALMEGDKKAAPPAALLFIMSGDGGGGWLWAGDPPSLHLSHKDPQRR